MIWLVWIRNQWVELLMTQCCSLKFVFVFDVGKIFFVSANQQRCMIYCLKCTQCLCMMSNVIIDKRGNEIIAVIITRLFPVIYTHGLHILFGLCDKFTRQKLTITNMKHILCTLINEYFHRITAGRWQSKWSNQLGGIILGPFTGIRRPQIPRERLSTPGAFSWMTDWGESGDRTIFSRVL